MSWIGLSAKAAIVLGATGGVVFPTLAGYAQHQGFGALGLGLWASAAVSVIIGILGYLEPVGPGTFQQVDIAARQKTTP